MYESSTSNAGLLQDFASAGTATRASSIFEPLYHMLPQRTDFTIFRRAGLRGLSFAFIGGADRYHTKEDRVENLDKRSLQDLGEHALALSRFFGDSGVRSGREDVVYFDLLGAVLIRYPNAWGLPLAALALLCLLAALIFGLARKALTPGGIVRGLITFAAGWIALVLTNSIIAWLLLAILPLELSGERISEPLPYLIILFGLTLALSAAFLRSQLKRTTEYDLAAGAWLWWAVLLVATVVELPQGSYLFSWPLLFASIGLAWQMGSLGRGPAMKGVVSLVGAVPGIVLWIPIIAVGWTALGLPGAGAVLGAVFLLATLLLPGMGPGGAKPARRSGGEP
jgi:hypothetical protein